MYHSVLQRLQYVALCCSVLQCVAVRCSVLQCVAVASCPASTSLCAWRVSIEARLSPRQGRQHTREGIGARWAVKEAGDLGGKKNF